jgi:hypothetical protein
MEIRLAVAFLAAVLSPLAFAQVSGTVKLDGKPPEMKTVDMSAVQDCAKQHAKPVQYETVLVGDKGGLANVVVSIKKAKRFPTTASRRKPQPFSTRKVANTFHTS